MNLSRIITKAPGLSSQLLKHHRNSEKHLQCVKTLLSSDESGEVFRFDVRSVQTGAAHYSSPLTDPENKGESQRGVNFDTLGSWNNRLSMPIMVDKSIEKGKLIPKIPLDQIGKASLLGRRRENEDRFSYAQLTDDILYFGIFDGHGGSLAVDFVNDNIQEHIKHWLTQTKDLKLVIQNAFLGINNLLTRHISHYHLDSTEFQNTGTTATVCLLRNSIELVVGHVGDTRAILCREGKAVRLTEDHDPDDYNEQKRIKKQGGHITENSLGVSQVNGRLAMTRSIGDVELKPYGVTSDPHIRTIEVRHGKDAFLVLATDGITFVLNDQEMMDIIGSCVTPTEAAELMTDQALQFGSEDNSSAMIIPFGAWGKYRNTTRSIPYSFGRNLSNRLV